MSIGTGGPFGAEGPIVLTKAVYGAEDAFKRLPVHWARLVGVVPWADILAAHERNLEEERHRERVLQLRALPRRNHQTET